MAMSHKRDTVIQLRLNKMTELAEQRRSFLTNPPEWWREDFHIRIGGNGYTAVSLNDSSPLLGFGLGTSKTITTLEKHFAKKPNGAIKPEKRAQAWLIKQALNNKVNKLDFKESLGLRSNDIYEKLFFALDEVSIGDKDNRPINRTDILAVGIYGGVAYPVLIELKYGRHLTGKNGLLPQLDKYAVEMKKFEREFKRLLHACVGIDVNLSSIGKIMVWPKSPSGKVSDSVERCDKQMVTIIESDTDNWSNNIAFSFHPFNKVYPPVPYINEE
jgi:hypothetical protein